MAGYNRTSLANVKALQDHVSTMKYRYKMKGVFYSNTHAIETCGEIAPGQGGLDHETACQVTRHAFLDRVPGGATTTPDIKLDTHEYEAKSGF